jgi:hypothetical protein
MALGFFCHAVRLTCLRLGNDAARLYGDLRYHGDASSPRAWAGNARPLVAGLRPPVTCGSPGGAADSNVASRTVVACLAAGT